MAEPRLLQVGNEETTAKEKGESGLSSAQVGTEAKTVEKASEEPKGVYVANENVVSDNSKALRTSKEAPKGQYVAPTERLGGFERSAGEKGVVNTITVDEVKALIKQYGGSGDTYTKEEIDHIVETMRKGLYQEVDITEYPTLEDFLDSDGEEGIIYLYPVGNEGNNYYQYIWETTKEWISLGTTVVDLSDYYKKSEDIVPPTDNSKDIGSDTKRIKDIYLADKIKDGTNEMSVANIFNGLYGAYATNSTTTLQYETINDISISANTTFTLATAPSNTYPEYKANITNTDTANAITITLPSGTVIKGNVSISSNTFVIPAGSTVEVNIQNNKALVVEW